jgi:hypothetical protein
MVLIQQFLNFYFLSTNAVRFVPVQCSFPNYTALKANIGNAFHFAPTACSILFPNPHDIADISTNGYRFDTLDFTDYLKIHVDLANFLGCIIHQSSTKLIYLLLIQLPLEIKDILAAIVLWRKRARWGGETAAPAGEAEISRT